MSEYDYNQYGDIAIYHTGFGFKISQKNRLDDDSCKGGCSGCGH